MECDETWKDLTQKLNQQTSQGTIEDMVDKQGEDIYRSCIEALRNIGITESDLVDVLLESKLSSANPSEVVADALRRMEVDIRDIPLAIILTGIVAVCITKGKAPRKSRD